MANNNILIGAEGVDGANFLASCLSMSNNVYYNNCSLSEKIEFFFKAISEIKEENGLPIWSDVSMLFNDCARSKNEIKFSTYQSKKIYESVKSDLNNQILINKVQLPLFWPLTLVMEKIPQNPVVKLFESKYFIGLKNPDLFISLRTVLGNSDLDLLCVREFNLLPKDLQRTIKEKYKSNIQRLFQCDEIFINQVSRESSTLHKWNMHNMKCNVDYVDDCLPENKNKDKLFDLYRKGNDLIKNKITHEWDCNWFLSEDETIENLKFLYSEFELGKLDQKLISEMYKVWIDRIDHIKKSHIKEFEVAINNFTFVNED
jgi:hypothetical protein